MTTKIKPSSLKNVLSSDLLPPVTGVSKKITSITFTDSNWTSNSSDYFFTTGSYFIINGVNFVSGTNTQVVLDNETLNHTVYSSTEIRVDASDKKLLTKGYKRLFFIDGENATLELVNAFKIQPRERDYIWTNGLTSSTRVYRFSCANDNTQAVGQGTVPAAQSNQCGTSNSDWGVTNYPVIYSLANETGSTLSSAPASSRAVDHGTSGQATGNEISAYFYGSNPKTSTVDRLDYSNGLWRWVGTGSYGPPLYGTASTDGSCATSTINHAYFGMYGRSCFERMSYSNETWTSVGTGFNTASNGMGLGNDDYVYKCGGYNTPAAYSTIYRMDVSTGVVAFKTNMSLPRYLAISGGPSNFGYIISGSGTPATTTSTRIDRLTYANDTSVGTRNAFSGLGGSAGGTFKGVCFGGRPG